MKRIAPLFLLPLLLAACGQPSTPNAAAPSSGLGPVAPGPNYVASFETGVARDLAALGLSDSLSGQAVAPKSYLNVLRVNDSSARAYLKTTYPAATGCTLDWGDGSSAAINTPSTVATDKQDHIYAQSGTYAIKLTCGTDIKTSGFTATVATTTVGQGFFDDFVGVFGQASSRGGPYKFVQVASTYSERGMDFLSSASFIVKEGYGLPNTHTAIALECRSVNSLLRSTTGRDFDLFSMVAGSLDFGSDNPVTLTAYGSGGNVIGTTVFTNNTERGTPVENRVLNWKNVNNVKIACNSNTSSYLNIDDMVVTIKTP